MVTIRYNDNEEMMEIRNQHNKVIFYGNYHDLDDSPHGLRKLFEKLLLDVDLKNDLPDVDSPEEEEDFNSEWEEEYD